MPIDKDRFFFLLEADDADPGSYSNATKSDDPSAHVPDNVDGITTDTEGDDSTDDGTTDADVDTTDATDNPNEDGGDDTDGTDPEADGGDDSTDSEPEVDPEEEKMNNAKRLNFFKNFKSVYLLVEDFIQKVDSVSFDELDDEKNRNLVVFIKQKSNKLLDNVNLILKDKIETIDLKVLETVFVNIKSEINLLVDIFEKVVKATDSETKKETN